MQKCVSSEAIEIIVRGPHLGVVRWLYCVVETRCLTRQAPSPLSLNTAPHSEWGLVIF
jgi:hypothetical protein